MILDKNYRFPSYHEIINPKGNLSMGLFGDSFGKPSMIKLEDSWNYLLAKKIGVNSFGNYCYNGSSIYYAYNTFLEYHHMFDIVIVLITNILRYPNAINIGKEKNITVPGIKTIEKYEKEKNITVDNIEFLKLLKHWFLLDSSEYLADMQDLMVKEIIRLRPDAIIIPCFEKSLKSDMFINFGLLEHQNMYLLTTIQKKSLGADLTKNWNEIDGPISCHLTTEMNKFFSDIVYDRYITGKWNWLMPKSIPHEHSFDFYYEKVK